MVSRRRSYSATWNYLSDIDLTLPLQQTYPAAIPGGNFKTIGLIWILGLLVWVCPNFNYSFYQGVCPGFYSGVLVQELGYKGVIFSVASVLPPIYFLFRH